MSANIFPSHAGDSQSAITRILIKHRAEVDAPDLIGRTALHYAAGENNVAAMRILLKAGADVNIADVHGRTPLHLAVVKDGADTARLLIESKRSDLNSKDANGMTPLHIAAAKGNEDIVRLLIGAGADINAVNVRRQTPLLLAVQSAADGTLEHMEVAYALIEAGTDVNIIDQSNHPVLYYIDFWAYDEPLYWPLFSLLKKVADPLAGQEERANATNILFEACKDGDTDKARAAIDAGADVDQTRKDGMSPLHIAIEAQSVEIVRMLLEAYACPELPFGKDKLTPLHMAAINGNLDIARVLIKEFSACVNALDANHWAPIHHAYENNNQAVAALLAENGADLRAGENERSAIS